MGIKKTIKNLLERRKKLRVLETPTVINLEKFDDEKKTIVFLSKGFPTHDKDSGSNRLKEIIFQFKKLNFNCIIGVQNVFVDNSYVQFYSEKGCIVYVENKKFKNIFEFLKSLKKIDLFWYNGPDSFHAYFSKTKKIHPNSVAIYDMVDIHFLRYRRAIELEPRRISLRKKYKKYYHIETKLAQKADKIIAISDKEKNTMGEFLDDHKIITISNIHYPKIKKQERENFENSEDLIFVGSIHEPNIDAISFLYNEILPKVWDKNPHIKVKIIGNVIEKINPIDFPKLDFLGYVENIESILKKSKIMIAPLRYGAGVKGKIGQAFEYYLPVITTDIGAEGMRLENKKNALIVNSAQDFATAILDLYSNKDLWNKLSENSEKSLAPFSIEQINKAVL